MQITRLTPADAMAYKALMLHAYEHAADSFTSTPQERALQSDAWWVHRIADPAGLSVVWGAFTEAGLMGTVSVEFSVRAKTRHKGLIVAMFVCEECRGKGVAGELMRSVIQHCMARKGLRLLQLEVTQGNVPAERLYQSLGFQSFGVEPMAVLTTGGYLAKVHMWLDLVTATKVTEST
jgi:GNAT superfamily N-acetyltransferase